LLSYLVENDVFGYQTFELTLWPLPYLFL